MYDKGDGGKRLRMYNGCGLAWWHTFKHACLRLWKVFSREIFAPLWHHLYPGHTFFEKPGSLPMVMSHLLYIQMSRDAVIEELTKLHNDMTLPLQTSYMVDDLHFLVEIAIPVVRKSACRRSACTHLTLFTFVTGD